MPTTVRSHAKINLGLYIGAPRPDGFHPLSTVYQTLEIHDFVTVSASPALETSIRITSNDPRVPTDNRNTAWKMAALALQDLETPASVSIYIDKRLPIQGGLGAGSANAIAALVGLECELERTREKDRALTGSPVSWLDTRQFAENMGVPDQDPVHLNTGNWPSRQIDLAAKVGSDVPLFLVGGAILGRGRGETVYPLHDFEPTWCIIATPPIGVSTPQAFRDWDALCAAERLTMDASDDRLEKLSRAYVSAFGAMHGLGSSGVPAQQNVSGDRDLAGPKESALVRTGITSWIRNDFERVVFPQHPSLAEIKRTLAVSGTPEAAIHASLSGSGSALFGLYLTREHAQAAQERLTAAGVDNQITQTLPRSKYWTEMIVD